MTPSLPLIYFTIIIHTINFTLFRLLNNACKKPEARQVSPPSIPTSVLFHHIKVSTAGKFAPENSLQKVAHGCNTTSACVCNSAIMRPIFTKLTQPCCQRDRLHRPQNDAFLLDTWKLLTAQPLNGTERERNT